MERDAYTTREAPVGVLEAVKMFAASVVAHLHTRLALFSTELAEEKLRLLTLFYGALTALFFFFTAIVLALLFVIAVYWDTPYRLHAIAVLAILFLSIAVVAWSRVRVQLASSPRLFETSLGELYKDRQQLDSP